MAPSSVCSQCGKEDIKTSRCTGCQSVCYCSKECQLHAWKFGGHKNECAHLRASRKAVVKGAPAESTAIECAACGKVRNLEGNIFTCAHCHCASYCSRACQSEHWKRGHSLTCVTPQEQFELVSSGRKRGIPSREWMWDLHAAGDRGHIEAQFELGVLYQNGLFEFKKNENKAVEWFKRAAASFEKATSLEAQGFSIQAMRILGLIYLGGTDAVNKNIEIAVEFIAMAAKLGDPDARCWLCDNFECADVSEQNKPIWGHWLRMAVEHGDPAAQVRLGLRLWDGLSADEGMINARSLFLKAADAGNMDARYELGEICLAMKEVDAAMDYLWNAAEQFHAPSLYKLGMMYFEGIHVPRNAEVGLRNLELAALEGDAESQFELFCKHIEDVHDVHDDEKALYWLKKSADNGHVAALNTLGCFLFDGLHGLVADAETAKEMFEKAAQAGDASAQHNLANCLEDGFGGESDMEGAAHWHRKAAHAGNRQSQLWLGSNILTGKITAEGDEDALNLLGHAPFECPPKMTPENVSSTEALELISLLETDRTCEEKAPRPRQSISESDSDSADSSTECDDMADAELNQEPEITKEADRLFREANSKLKPLDLRVKAEIDKWANLQNTTEMQVVLKLLSKAAEAGHPEAQFKMGEIYRCFRGNKMKQDALEWYQKAADCGHVLALFTLFQEYWFAIDLVKEDKLKALEYLRKAAARNHAQSQFELGIVLAEGEVVEKNDAESAKWYLRAANQGFLSAFSIMGIKYETGVGVRKSATRAFEMYEAGAAKGCDHCIYNLAVTYLYGHLKGRQRNPLKAAVLFTKAAELGNAFAQLKLGELYLTKAIGGKPNFAKAKRFLKLAAENKHQQEDKKAKARALAQDIDNQEERANSKTVRKDFMSEDEGFKQSDSDAPAVPTEAVPQFLPWEDEYQATSTPQVWHRRLKPKPKRTGQRGFRASRYAQWAKG